jgi:hypothetical protein
LWGQAIQVAVCGGPTGGHAVVGRLVVGAQWVPLPVKKCAKSSQ